MTSLAHKVGQDAWLVETELLECTPGDFDAADCAELPDELALYDIMAKQDDAFSEKLVNWHTFILDNNLWLPLEQCCHDGVLLALGQRELRIQTCPRDLLEKLSYFFSSCPIHVQHIVVLKNWIIVRTERARRTGSPIWQPSK